MAFDLSIVGKSGEPSTFEYDWKDVVLYALGIGAKVDELDYLYEGRGPKTYPSFAVVPAFAPMFGVLAKSGANFAMVVHGAQKVRLHKPIAPAGKLITTATIRGIYDLKKLASVIVDTKTVDGAGEHVFDTTWNIVVRGAGGFGGEPPVREETLLPPQGKSADFRVEEGTTKEQALLYRLSGDFNPLHADPAFAKSVGFEAGPILHGLCTLGHMVRHAVKGACEGDASRLAAFEAKFSKPVWPGDTLVTEGWKHEDGRYALTTSVKERNEAVITAASITLR